MYQNTKLLSMYVNNACTYIDNKYNINKLLY